MTVNNLFLYCSQINEYTRFVIFEDFTTYLFNEAPIADDCFEDLDPEITSSKVAHFRIDADEDIVYVEVVNNDN